jgi:hypothetical protein
MALQFEDTKLGAQALAYVIELYRELTVENGAPTLGTQNQAVDFIRSDPELRRAVSAWAEAAKIDEATMAPRQRLPQLSRALSVEELRAWERDFERHGLYGLRATRVQIYRLGEE